MMLMILMILIDIFGVDDCHAIHILGIVWIGITKKSKNWLT